MDFYNKLKSFLGIPSPYRDDKFNNCVDIPDHRDCLNTRPEDEHEQLGFNVFSNPLEMHKYFEHQMNEMMKSFGIFNNDSSFFGNDESFFGEFSESTPFHFGFSQFPKERDVHEIPSNDNLRDNFFKSGYEDPSDKETIKTDSDLDEQYRSGDLNHAKTRKQIPSQFSSFSKSVVTKTVRSSDGIIETHKSVQDQNGNREETVTRKRGDKEYTVITRTDKNGIQEIKENLVNIDESEKDSFLQNKSPLKSILNNREKDMDKSLFTKFFKL